MTLLIVSFLAGVLTVFAPCILPLLPVIVGGSVVRSNDKQASLSRPIIISLSLAGSIVVFTLLLKASTGLLGVPQTFWQTISGIIVVGFGLSMLLPTQWAKLIAKLGLESASGRLLGSSYQREGLLGDIFVGAALGPVFSSCSPTYALIVAAVLPVSFIKGLIYLLAYAVGLAGSLLIIAFAGQSLINRFGWLSNPESKFRHFVGILFVVVGLMVILGLDRELQAYILERGWYDPISNFEQRFDLTY